MRNDLPAAFPLIFLIAGLAIGTHLVNPWIAIVGLIVVSAKLRHTLFAVLGIALALHVQSREARERAAFASIDPDRFVIVEAPLERDWAEHESSFVLRASQFRVVTRPSLFRSGGTPDRGGDARPPNDFAFDAPIRIYARFEPPQIGMEATLRAEGFLRLSEYGGYTLSIKSPRLMAYDGTLSRWDPRAWNRALANALERHQPAHPEEVALAQSLVLGRGELLTEEMRENFRRGGTYHLLVFSGLQIAFAAGLLAALLRWLHAPRASDCLLLIFAALSPLFIGPTASVSRASIGIALYALSRICKRPTSLQNLWCVSALLRLILEPRDLSDPSFHLTYAGAGALLFIAATRGEAGFSPPEGRRAKARRSTRFLTAVMAAEVAITPLTLHHFHQYALGGAVLTFVMAPLIFVMLVLSSLACAFPPLFAAIGVLHRLCAALNALGFSGWLAAPPLPALIGGAGAALIALATLRGRARAVAIMVALLVPSVASVVRSHMERTVDAPTVTFLDIGQGDAIAVRERARTILIDGGRDPRIVPLLVDRGIRRIDAVILTHAHPDHCEGLAAVVAQLDVAMIGITPRRFRGDCASKLLEAARESRTPIRFIRDGDVLPLGEMRLTAHLTERVFRRAPENNASIVLRLDAGGRHMLFTGDIEKEAELTLADRDLQADVLKVAHHGSRSSTAETFLDVVRPRIAVISCGRRNLFGHPHPDVLETLASRDIRVWRTDRDGSIDVTVEEGRLFVRVR